MTEFHSNTWKLVKLQSKAVELGFADKYPYKDFCQEIARFSNELGDDYPSDQAIKLAERWVEELKETGKIKDLEYDPHDKLQIYIKNEGGWEELFYALTPEEVMTVFLRLKNQIEKWKASES